MASWATDARFAGAGFVCVCVDPNALATAKEFRQLYFAAAPEALVNGYIDSEEDFPDFDAQLGCQGFIIFNSAHEIVESSSPAWLAHRESAFQHVERQLLKLVGTGSLADENPLRAPLGQLVRIQGIASGPDSSLNGQEGEVDGSDGSGSFLVAVGGEQKRILPENLEDATGAPVGKRMRLNRLGDMWGKHNGHDCEVLGGTASGRLIVQVGENRLSVNPRNLQAIPLDEADEVGARLGKVGSVGHEGMDAQHQECIAALKELSSCLTACSLQRARTVLREHFDEEETLLTDSGFGGGGFFSALASHAKDHDRIIRLADEALAKLSENGAGSSTPARAIPREIAVSLCRAFVEHATMYDSLYEGKLGNSAA